MTDLTREVVTEALETLKFAGGQAYEYFATAQKYEGLCNFAQAAGFYERALSIAGDVLGYHHPVIAVISLKLADAQSNQSNTFNQNLILASTLRGLAIMTSHKGPRDQSLMPFLARAIASYRRLSDHRTAALLVQEYDRIEQRLVCEKEVSRLPATTPRYVPIMTHHE